MAPAEIDPVDILDSVTDAVFAIDRSWRYVYVNAAGEALARRARAELLGAVVWDAFPNAVGTAYETAYRQAMEGGATVHVDDVYIERLDVWTSLRVSANPNGITVCVRDVTAEKRALEEKLGAERRLRAMFEASPVPTYAWQRDGDDFVLIDFNEAAARITGGGIHDVLGSRLADFYADAPVMVEHIRRAADDAARPHREEIDYVFRTTGKRQRAVMTFVSAAPDLVLVHAEDFTDQRQAEALSRGLAEQAITGVYVFQGNRFVYANPHLAEMLGYTVAELLSRRGWRWFVHESSWCVVEQQTEEHRAGRSGRASYVFKAVRKDGVAIDVEIHGTSINYGGRPALLGAMLDVTERKRSEEERLALANHVRLLLESTTQGLYGTDADGQITFVNGAGAAALGYTPSELAGRHVDRLVQAPAENGIPSAASASSVIDVVRCGECVRVERDVLWRRDGTALPVSYAASPVFIDGQIGGTVVAFTDETDRRAAEVALREREEQLAAIVSIQEEVATARMDLDHVMQLVAQRAQALTGADGVAVELVEKDEIVYRTVTGSIQQHGGMRLKLSASLSGQCVRTGDALRCDDSETDSRVDRDACRRIGARSLVMTPLVHEGHAIGVLKLVAREPGRFAEREVRTLRLLGGSLGAAIGRAIDFQAKEAMAAERAAALEALQAREAHFRALIESATDPIVLVDAQGRRTYASPAFLRVLGYDDSAPHGDAMGLLHPDDTMRARELLGRLVATPEGEISADVRIRHANGHYRVITCSGRNLLAHPAVRAIVVNLRDITDQKQLEEQLRQSQKMEAVGQLAGGVAHDFNNLLTVIQVSTEFLLERLDPDDPSRDDAMEIRQSAQRAAALTRQLLAFSRRQVLRPRALDLNATVSDMGRLLGRLIADDIQVLLDLGDDLGSVMADPGQIEQVLMNLAVNARDSMPEGGRLTIGTANADLDVHYQHTHAVVPPGAYVMLTVSDTGHGMDSATLERVFEPFFTTKSVGKGTGLGLSTVYGIVKQSEGFIWVYSEPGHGTTFKVYLPRIAETEAHDLVETHAASAGGGETLLLVEDADSVRAVSRRILERFGYRVLEANNGRAAVALASNFEGRIHALVTDAVMPEMGGRDLAEALRRARPDVRVLYMSGFTDDDMIRRGILAPGSSFLEKPFSAQSLGHAVREMLDFAER